MGSSYTANYGQKSGPYKSLRERVSVGYCHDGGAIGANATRNGLAVDVHGYNSVDVIAFIGTHAAGAATLKVQEASAPAGPWEDIPASRIQGGDDDGRIVVNDNSAEDKTKKLSAFPEKRYVRAVWTTGAGANAVVNAAILLGHPTEAPTPATF